MLSSHRDPGNTESLVGLFGVMVRKIPVRLSRIGVHLVISQRSCEWGPNAELTSSSGKKAECLWAD